MKVTPPGSCATGAGKPTRHLPGWVYVAVLVGLGLFAYQQYSYWSIPASARAAGAGLRASAAYADPDEPGVIDLARARQVIGDRPILVAVLPAQYPARDLDACLDVAGQHPKNVVVAYKGAHSPTLCAGSQFPSPTTDDLSASEWIFRTAIQTQYSSRYRVSETGRSRTAEVEELVLAFDAQVQEDYADGVPTREADPDPVVWWRVMLQLAGLIILAVGVFAGVRAAANRIVRNQTARAALRARRLDLQQELSEAASEVMVFDPNERPERARLRASTAEHYLQTLTAFEAARTQEELDAAQTDFAELANSVQELRRVPEKAPENAAPARGRISRWWRNR